MRIGFLGAGKIAQALARGIIHAEITKPEMIVSSSPQADEPLLKQMRELGCITTYRNADVIQQSNVVIMAVKPVVVTKILSEVHPHFTLQHLLVSIAMGTTISSMEKILPAKSRVIRVMPNTPALVRAGASVFARGRSANSEDVQTVRNIFSSVGICEEAQEHLLDAVTALSGSGPAYMYMAIDAMADGAVKMGIGRDLALRLATQTMLGSARMVLETGRHPGSLKDDVCSPGGTTIYAVHRLEKRGFRYALMDAIEAATLRSKDTGRSQ